jgi:hypothetical protein
LLLHEIALSEPPVRASVGHPAVKVGLAGR